MTIPEDWLCGPADLDEVEARLATRQLPDLWLRRWWALLARMAPGDALWGYSDRVEHPAAPEPAAEPIPGFEQVRDAEALRRLGLADPAVDRVEYRFGFALVRDGVILDWIEDVS